jgi:hypothetical protein
MAQQEAATRKRLQRHSSKSSKTTEAQRGVTGDLSWKPK